MSTRIQRRGGTAAEHSSFTGAPRELSVDTDTWNIRIHDGSTPGGHPAAKKSEVDAALAGKAASSHSHVISEVTGLQTALDGKAAVVAIASQVEAEAGSNNAKLMTPLRSKQAFDVFAPAYNRWETIALQGMAGLSQVVRTDLGDFASIRFEGDYLPGTDGVALALQYSADNGSTWIAGTNYFYTISGYVGAYSGSTTASQASMFLTFSADNVTVSSFQSTLFNFNVTRRKRAVGLMGYATSTGVDGIYSMTQGTGGTLSSVGNAIKIFPASGVVTTGLVHIEGIRG